MWMWKKDVPTAPTADQPTLNFIYLVLDSLCYFLESGRFLVLAELAGNFLSVEKSNCFRRYFYQRTNYFWLFQHISTAPISRCTKSSGCISVMFTRNVRSNFIQPEDMLNLRPYCPVSLCCILIHVLRMTITKTCAACQRHVEDSMHG